MLNTLVYDNNYNFKKKYFNLLKNKFKYTDTDKQEIKSINKHKKKLIYKHKIKSTDKHKIKTINNRKLANKANLIKAYKVRKRYTHLILKY